MSAALQEYLDTLSIGERLDHDNLSLFPILSENDVSPSFILLDEALEKNFLEVTA